MATYKERKARIRATRAYRQRHELAMAVSADRRRMYRILFYLLAVIAGLAALLINFVR